MTGIRQCNVIPIVFWLFYFPEKMEIGFFVHPFIVNDFVVILHEMESGLQSQHKHEGEKDGTEPPFLCSHPCNEQTKRDGEEGETLDKGTQAKTTAVPPAPPRGDDIDIEYRKDDDGPEVVTLPFP